MDPARGLQLWPWCPARTISRRARAQAKIPSCECTSSLDVKSLYSPRRDRNNWNVLRAEVGQASGLSIRAQLGRPSCARMHKAEPYATSVSARRQMEG